MTPITADPTREIIEDFAKEIKQRQLHDQKPSKTIIRFRSDVQDKKEREIVKVPIDILRYRKDNGRIASDVLDYEINVGPLNEREEETQKLLQTFLYEKDQQKAESLKKSIMHEGQSVPAIITCDGFLINGNRRRMVIKHLSEKYPEKEDYKYMSVVILPGEDDEGGPPTLNEIDRIENRYQMQDDGRSEYSGFDLALTFKRRIDRGFSLKAQLRDDPRYSKLSSKDMKRQIKKIEKDYLQPLECAERYLKQFNKEGQYRLVSKGMSDKEGRWQALIDYSNTYNLTFKNPSRLIKHNIEEDEVGDLEVAAFNIIRLRTFPNANLPKAHQIMRNLSKYCASKEGKKALLQIANNVEPQLPNTECVDEHGKQLKSEVIEHKWKTNNQQEITYRLKKAVGKHEIEKERETPLQLLEAALKKITHEDLDITAIKVGDFSKARNLASEIGRNAKEIESAVYAQMKNFKNLNGTKL